MGTILISQRAIDALSAAARRGFERRVVSFLTEHAPEALSYPKTDWRSYEMAARELGFVSEQEIVFCIFACAASDDDVLLSDRAFFASVAKMPNSIDRINLLAERVSAAASQAADVLKRD
jgi:hypothetical protein